MSELITTGDIAQYLGVTREYVTDKLTKRPDFPKPAICISQKLKKWRRDEVLAYCSGKKR